MICDELDVADSFHFVFCLLVNRLITPRRLLLLRVIAATSCCASSTRLAAQKGHVGNVG